MDPADCFLAALGIWLILTEGLLPALEIYATRGQTSEEVLPCPSCNVPWTAL
jgi:hypothetical protein